MGVWIPFLPIHWQSGNAVRTEFVWDHPTEPIATRPLVMRAKNWDLNLTPTTATRTSPRYSATHFRMDKTTFIRTLTEERCDDFRLRLDMKTEGELKVTWIAPLMRTTWICWWSSRVPPRMLSGHRPSPRGAQAHFVEMVPRRSVRNGSVGFHSVLAWFRLS